MAHWFGKRREKTLFIIRIMSLSPGAVLPSFRTFEATTLFPLHRNACGARNEVLAATRSSHGMFSNFMAMLKRLIFWGGQLFTCAANLQRTSGIQMCEYTTEGGGLLPCTLFRGPPTTPESLASVPHTAPRETVYNPLSFTQFLISPKSCEADTVGANEDVNLTGILRRKNTAFPKSW